MAQVLARNVALGVNPRVTARQMRDEFGAAETRALTIARTESLRAFRAASRMTFAENSDSLDGWIWLSANNKRTCVSCLAMHGSVHPLTEEMQEHINGRCVAAPRVKGANLRVETGAERFERWAERDQRAALGPAMYEAWRDGAVRLTPGGAGSIVGRRVSQQWGDSVYVRSLRAIVGPEWASVYREKVRLVARGEWHPPRSEATITGVLGNSVREALGGRTRSRHVWAVPDTWRHIQERHEGQFDFQRGRSVLPGILRNPEFVLDAPKAGSVRMVGAYDGGRKLVVSVKVLADELWLETMHTRSNERFAADLKRAKVVFRRD